MQRDSSDAEVSEQQRHPLSVVTRAAENHEGISSQFIENRNQIAILKHTHKNKCQTH